MTFKNLLSVLVVICAGTLLHTQDGHAGAVLSNAAPIISGAPPLTVAAGSNYLFQPTASDPNGQRLRYTIVNKPAWAKFSTVTGKLSGTPASANVGTTSGIVISVNDGTLSASLAPFAITVTGTANRAPTISGAPPMAVAAGSAYAFQPAASDPDGQALSFTISNKPSWASFSSSTGRLSGTPSAADLGTVSDIVIRVSDGSLSAALAPFAITVNAAANRAPAISGTPSSSATVGVLYTFAPAASDPDGDALSWSITAKPAGASFSIATGQLSWTPTAAGSWAGIVITVTDSQGASASLPAFSITVPPPAPTGTAALTWQPPTQYIDGSGLPATDLAGFRIYRGTSAATLGRIAELDGGSVSFTVQNLGSGTHYFAVTAVTQSGTESALSEVKSKTIP